jgi:hypothetical protein
MTKFKDFMASPVTYDRDGQYLWAQHPKGSKGDMQMIGEIRGYGAIQNLFKDRQGRVDMAAAAKYQDELGAFIAEAIQEKLDGALDKAKSEIETLKAQIAELKATHVLKV